MLLLLTYVTAAHNPAKNLAGVGLGRICQKGPNAGPAGAGAGAEIRYIVLRIYYSHYRSCTITAQNSQY